MKKIFATLAVVVVGIFAFSIPSLAGTSSTVGSTGLTVTRIVETVSAPMGSSADYAATCPTGSKVLSGTIRPTSGGGSVPYFWIDESSNSFKARFTVPNIAPATLEVTATCVTFS